LPVSERLAEQICSVPLFPTMTDAECEQVAEAIVSFAKDNATAGR
jgi:dTDP-4-amino-4,6-dideoxygalactose transaminase